METRMDEHDYWSGLQQKLLTRRRFLPLAGVAAAGVALAGCASKSKTSGSSPSTAQAGNQTGQGTPQSGGTFTGYLNTNFPLDPHKISGSAHILTGGTYSRVLRYKTGADPKVYADHVIENDLGTSVESPDAITWTVKLRPDARFQNIPPVNGHAVEAEDIKATFTRALDPAIGSPNRGSLGMIDPAQIQTPDKHTVVFKLNYAYAPFRSILASPVYSLIVPREALTGSYDLSKVAIGSGPFMLDSATPDVAYVYKKNPDYYEKGRPAVDGLRVAVIPTVAQQLAQFHAGSLDELVVDNANDLATAKQDNPKAAMVKGDYGLASPIYFQMGDATCAFQDVRARRAISMAVDRDAFSKLFFNGDSVQEVFVPAFMGKWAQRIDDLPADTKQYYKYNPGEAKKLVDAAGIGGQQFKFVYTAGSGTNSAFSQRQAEALGNMLGAVGLKITLVAIDFNKDFIDSGRGVRQGFFDKDMILWVGQTIYSEADDWLFNYLHSKSTTPQENLKDPALDAMIDRERTLVNEDDRLKVVQDIQKYIADKMYLIGTAGGYHYAFTQPRVQNYGFSDGAGKFAETYGRLWLKQ
jgi:peptide/nickel transport system substrate-binding protein